MTAGAATVQRRLAELSRPADLAIRWLILLATTAVAFRSTITSLASTFFQGSVLTYLPAIALYALFAGVATLRRNRPRVEIHDRETDFIVGGVTALMAIVATTLLTPTLSGAYRMWRVDLLMMWMFVSGCGVLMFGLRRSLQFRWAWLTLGLIWPLPTRIVCYAIGNGSLRWVCGCHLLVIIILLSVGHRPRDRRWFIAPAVAVVVSVPLLALQMDRTPILVTVPPVVAMIVGGTTWWLQDHIRVPRLLAPPAVRSPWSAAVFVVILAVAAAFVVPPLPQLVEPTALKVAPGATGPGSVVPHGWRITSRSEFPGQSVYFGLHSSWDRYHVQAERAATGPGAVDPQGRHRDMVIDVVTTERPRTFGLFPIQTTYPVSRLSVTDATEVDLGHQVTGDLYAAVDSTKLVAWSMLTFTVTLPADRVSTHPDPSGPDVVAQRITLILVDDHRAGAPFPEPSHALLDSMRAVMTAILRGNTVIQLPEIKSADLLESAARKIISQRVAGSS